jgi:Transposase IS4
MQMTIPLYMGKKSSISFLLATTCLHAKDWTDIDQKDLESFFAVLFISGIQKRKDKPSNWFSNNPLLENPIIKKVMSGRKFFMILRYLHCCPAQNQNPNDHNYSPDYKVAEMRDYLEERYLKLYVPGQQLSLDETLIRAFGRIKFKVRIITKAARYGIKVYVITCAQTAFVFKVIFYTGRTTYGMTEDQQDKQDRLKTVTVVNQLVEPFVGSHRTLYVDRFYTSVDLLKSLAERNLYITGTMLVNRIPKHLRIAKKSDIGKQMNRGDAVQCKLQYKIGNEQTLEAGLVCWMDRNIVYCLTNDTNNYEFDECRRRGMGGIMRIARPIAISNYNKYMGGVDLADMRRLHCNSTIMGQNRWWLKLFFYLLDVGTSNALVLYNEAMKIRSEGAAYTKMNIVEYKSRLVIGLVGKSFDELADMNDKEEEEEHVPIRLVGTVRHRCVNCALTSSNPRRTRYQCSSCEIPLCSIGNGRVENDCFTIAHKSKERLNLICKKYTAMKKHFANTN